MKIYHKKNQYLTNFSCKALLVCHLFISLLSCEFSNREGNFSQEELIIKYIKTDTSDQSLKNIKELIKTGNYFDNTNYSIEHPLDGYLKYEIDSINEVIVFSFNPKINFEKGYEMKYLSPDKNLGKISNYQLIFEVNKKNKILAKRSLITFSKGGHLKFNNDSVPNLVLLLNEKIISKQKQIYEITKQEHEEKQILIEKMNEMDNSDFWNEFDPIVKERIYNLVQNKDCQGLQIEFNTTADNLDRYHASGRSSQRHSKLLQFVNEKLEEIGCYK